MPLKTIVAMNKEKKEKKTKRDTPIVDGDARPDMPLNPDTKGDKDDRRSKKFEEERRSDINTLEDYKDAKLNEGKKEE